MVPRRHDEWHELLPLLDGDCQPVNVIIPGSAPGQVCVFAVRVRCADVTEWTTAPDRAPAGH
jgi:hypothetical protein